MADHGGKVPPRQEAREVSHGGPYFPGGPPPWGTGVTPVTSAWERDYLRDFGDIRTMELSAEDRHRYRGASPGHIFRYEMYDGYRRFEGWVRSYWYYSDKAASLQPKIEKL
jgi:hypothetical protein